MEGGRILRIYTDGGCRGNQNEDGINTGGYGAILEFAGRRKELSGGERNTTNNRMEMKALIAALSAVTKPRQRIEVFSDSSYLTNCFREGWYKNWRRNGWKTSSKTAVENRELWEELLRLIEEPEHDISFFRVKGHVNPDGKSYLLSRDKLYEKFTEWNGRSFSLEDFEYVVRMNNRADELANLAMDGLSAS